MLVNFNAFQKYDIPVPLPQLDFSLILLNVFKLYAII